MTALLGGLEALWNQAMVIWVDGGWAMWGIAVTALAMFTMGVQVFLRLRYKGDLDVPEEIWRNWVDRPSERRGRIGQLLDQVAGAPSLEATSAICDRLRRTDFAPLERDLRVMKVCISAAPLVGLLGTVTGMLTTFNALATGSGGEKTMNLVAKGISEALITTETGLVVALPGLFLWHQLARKFEKHKAFLAHVETVCTQAVHRRQRRQRDAGIRRAAVAQLAEALHRGLSRAEAAVRRPGSQRAVAAAGHCSIDLQEVTDGTTA